VVQLGLSRTGLITQGELIKESALAAKLGAMQLLVAGAPDHAPCQQVSMNKNNKYVGE
jgi:hypothetical protein